MFHLIVENVLCWGARTIIAFSVPLQKRPIYSSVATGMYGVASVAGPLLGGLFTDKVSWRLCFSINLPLGAIAIVMVSSFLSDPRRMNDVELGWELLERFDITGNILFISAIICLLLALQWGGSKYSWSDGRIIALLVIFGVLTAVFVAIQIKKQESATVPPRIVKNRSMMSAILCAGFIGASFFIVLFYLPTWFQVIRGVSAVRSGILTLPIILSLVLGFMLSALLVTKIGYYAPLMIASSIVLSIGVGLLSTLKVDSGPAMRFGYQIIVGIDMGLGWQQAIDAGQTVLGLDDIPIWTTVIFFSQTIGGAIFSSVGQNILANRLVEGLRKHVPAVEPRIVLNIGDTDLKRVVPREYLDEVIRVYNSALKGVFQVSLVMACLNVFGSATIKWLSIKTHSPISAQVAHGRVEERISQKEIELQNRSE